MKKIWLKNYPPGVPHEIDTGAYTSLVQLCEDAWKNFPDKRAFGNFSSYLTYADVERLSEVFAGYLQHHAAIHGGERVAIMMPNTLQYPVAMLGILRAGGIVVNTNPQYTARELRHQLVDSGAEHIVIFRNMLPTLHEIVDTTALKSIIVTNLGDLFPFPKSLVYNYAARRGRKSFCGHFDIEVVAFRDTLKRGAKSPFSSPSIGPDDLAFLQYTGGTTGISKGAMLSHGNVVANILQVSAWFSGSAEKGAEIIITVLPLYHIYALTLNCFGFFHHGGMNYLITDPRDTKRLIKELSRVPFTAITGVNTLFRSLLADEKIGEVDFSHLKYTSGGGMAVQSSVADAWQALTGTIISEGYGLTEASPAVCVNPFEAEEFTGSIGLPMPSTVCRIVKDDGEEANVGEPGELQVRGPQVMQGYWRRPEETSAVLDECGWLRTGDIAVMNEDGFFRIVDRKKDMIIVSGFNVYPSEIEDVVVSHPGIDEAAAIGVADAKTTEAVMIVAVRNDPDLSPKDLISYCREQLTGYKVPRRIEFVDSLPKSPVGKILRRVVKEDYGDSNEA